MLDNRSTYSVYYFFLSKINIFLNISEFFSDVNVVYAERLEVKILKKRLIMVKLCRDINIGGEVASCDREQPR